MLIHKPNKTTRLFLQYSGLILGGLLSISAYALEKIAETNLNKPADLMLYQNKPYHFSFKLPATWERQSGQANGDNGLFMPLPLSQSCRFQFNITQMPTRFQAEAAVNRAFLSARMAVRSNQLISVKRRDSWGEQKLAPTEKTKEKIVLTTQGWQVFEKAHPHQQQRMIYQTYDRANRYFVFTAAASSEKFASCQSQLQEIMNSIEFVGAIAAPLKKETPVSAIKTSKVNLMRK